MGRVPGGARARHFVLGFAAGFPAGFAGRFRVASDSAHVVGAGVVGACVARDLARMGEDVLVVDRDAPGQQASTANAGSLHVQLLSFDFGAKAEAGGGPAARTLRLGPPAVALWHAIGEEAKASGLVARLIAKHGVKGLSVAPPG
ncbi:MAG: FAD-binding oxidoreductase [Pseudomonas sp.]|nr:FAD-binding oxidoreductase [Pseudomonas sp.]